MSALRQILSPLLAIEAGEWPNEHHLEKRVADALDATEAELGLSKAHPSEISFLFTDDATIQQLNKEWRGKNKPTNVLSFPAFPLRPGQAPKPVLGDVVFAYETILREAMEEQKSFDDHLSHLIIHGLLHLLGYDHETETDAELMEGLERRILHALAIPDPYAVSDAQDV